jgi:hypothetical protein
MLKVVVVQILGVVLLIVISYFTFVTVLKIIEFVLAPDTRTTEQIKMDEYKECIKSAFASQVSVCKNYLTN